MRLCLSTRTMSQLSSLKECRGQGEEGERTSGVVAVGPLKVGKNGDQNSLTYFLSAKHAACTHRAHAGSCQHAARAARERVRGADAPASTAPRSPAPSQYERGRARFLQGKKRLVSSTHMRSTPRLEEDARTRGLLSFGQS